MKNKISEDNVMCLGYFDGLSITESVSDNDIYRSVINKTILYIQNNGLLVDTYINGLVMGVILGYRFENRKNDDELLEIESKLNRLFYEREIIKKR